MKRILILAIFAMLVIFAGASAQPMFFDIMGSNSGFLGTIEAFTGDMTAESYYQYYGASGHPNENGGPMPTPYASNIWMYYGTDGLSFNFIHGADGQGGNYWNHVQWDLGFHNMNYNILFTDDGTPENHGEQGMVDYGGGTIQADFAYINNTDGGIVGIDPFNPCDWMIEIRPYRIGDITDINFASANGSNINGLHLDFPYIDIDDDPDHYRSGNYQDEFFYITPHCDVVPEPATLILLGIGLIGTGIQRRRKNK